MGIFVLSATGHLPRCLLYTPSRNISQPSSSSQSPPPEPPYAPLVRAIRCAVSSAMQRALFFFSFGHYLFHFRSYNLCFIIWFWDICQLWMWSSMIWLMSFHFYALCYCRSFARHMWLLEMSSFIREIYMIFHSFWSTLIECSTCIVPMVSMFLPVFFFFFSFRSLINVFRFLRAKITVDLLFDYIWWKNANFTIFEIRIYLEGIWLFILVEEFDSFIGMILLFL